MVFRSLLPHVDSPMNTILIFSETSIAVTRLFDEYVKLLEVGHFLMVCGLPRSQNIVLESIDKPFTS
jgi:hypothetical protein